MSIFEYMNKCDERRGGMKVDTEVYKALSDESRLRMLNILMQRELCVCEIEAVLGMSQSNVSRHLTKLKNAGIVGSKKHSQWAYYHMHEDFKVNNPHLYTHLTNSARQAEVLVRDIEKLRDLDENCDD